MRQQKGSITIFSLLAMLVVMTTIFSFLEMSRFQELKRLGELQTEIALESVFANYSSYLWENYHLLGCNLSQMESIMTEVGNGRYDKNTERTNLLLFQVQDVEVQEYTLLTDGNGAAYIHAVAGYMEEHILYETAKEIFSQYEAINDLKKSSTLDMSNIDKALEEMKKVEVSEGESNQEIEKSVDNTRRGKSIGSSKKQEVSFSNPLEEIKQVQEAGILELVLEDTSGLSDGSFSLSEAVSNRRLATGNSHIEETDWLDKVWLQQYLLMYMSNFCNNKEGHSLSYEMEYLIGGKDNDCDNLKVVVTELLGIREMANFLYLMSDVKKVGEARALATALVGVSGNPLLIEVVTTGLLTAWAFGESILDVRSLLQNKHVPLIKNASLWTLELENIGEISQGYLTAKEGEWGLSYENYLAMLLLFQSEKILAKRGMDMQEATLKQLYGNDIQLDQFMISAHVRVTYIYSAVFSSLEQITTDMNWTYQVSSVSSFGYY